MGMVLGFLILALDIWAIYKTLTSGATGLVKGVWVLVILLLPVVGLIAWLIAGPRNGSISAV